MNTSGAHPTSFEKVQACGNDFILLDHTPDKAQISALCDRHHGVGGDGIMVYSRGGDPDLILEHYDPDGASSFCLNGTRAALYCLHRRELARVRGTLISSGVALNYEIQTHPRLYLPKRGYEARRWRHIDGFYAHVGNPHFIIVGGLERKEWLKWAPEIRSDRETFPEGTNVHLLRERSDEWQIASYERGVEGVTLACGSGMYAAALVLMGEGSRPQVMFSPEGKGTVQVTDQGETLAFEGPAHWVYSGVLTC